MSKVQEKLTLLTPGSVWLSAKGTPSYVLFITNENVPAAKQKQFPPQVVFADEEGELFNVHLDRFLENRAFHHVEWELEQKIENLFVSEPKPEEVDNGDAVDATDVQPTTEREQSILELEEAAEQSDNANKIADSKLLRDAARGLKSVFQFAHEPGLEDPVLNSIVLANALRSFSQEPNISEKQLVTRLTFLLDASVTLDSLDETFSDAKVNEAHRRGIVAITAQSSGHIETFVWDQYLGAYPVYTDGGAYGVVLLAQSVDVEQTAEEFVADVDPASADELGALMGDGGMSNQSPADNNTQLTEAPEIAQGVAMMQQSPAEAFQQAIQPAATTQQTPAVQPVVQVQPTVNVVSVQPSAPSGN